MRRAPSRETMIPRVGDTLEDFTLPYGTSEGRGEATLSKLLGHGDVVIAFYPLAFTGTCTRQMCEARDRLGELAKLHAHVFGFSIDTVQSNAAYAREHKLPFPLLSDPNRRVVERIWETETVAGVERCAKRGMLVLDAHGRVKYVWVADKAGDWPGLDETMKHVTHGH